MQEREPVLCYVDGQWAYFTTQPLSEQWGDDWDDVPYEHNAGAPYPPPPVLPDGVTGWRIVKFAWDGSLLTPDYGVINSPWSVQDINSGLVPWLMEPKWAASGPRRSLRAGATVQEFKDFVQACGGKVYEETK